MRDFLLSGRWLRTWWFWAFVLLALPNCGLNSEGCMDCPVIDDCSGNDPDPECDPGNCDGDECEPDPCEEDPDAPGCNPDPCEEDPDGPECVPPDPVEEFKPGTSPADAILCEIPKPLEDGDDGCATQAEADDLTNISLAEAATALVNGDFSGFALDFSDEAKAACGGLPKKIEFYGEFPDGLRVCINCGTQIGNANEYATTTKACIAKCKDKVNFEGPIPAEGAEAFCLANAKLATNHEAEICYGGACTAGGSPNLSWVDPRKSPEPVVWIDHIGTSDNSGTNDLERTAPTSTPAAFDAGAASAQTIAKGDAWVEFAAGDTTGTTHILGLRTSCADAITCPDMDPDIATVGFAIYLYADGQVYVLEPGATPGTFNQYGPFGPYTVGERYRIRVTDNNLTAATASISYHRVVGGVEQPAFATNTSADPAYPLRVDTTFIEFGALIADVTIVRIK